MVERMPRPAEELEKSPAEEAKETFEKAGKDPGFVDFLGRIPGAENLSFTPDNEAKIVKYYENYETGNKALAGLAGFYKSEIGDKLGIKIDPKELGGKPPYENLKEYLLAEAANNPEKVREIVEKTERYNELKEELSALDQAITKEGGKENREAAIEQLERQENVWAERKEVAERSVGFRGFLNTRNSELIGWAVRGVGRMAAWLTGESQKYKEHEQMRLAMRSKTGEQREEFLEYVGNKINQFTARRKVLEATPELREQAEKEIKDVRTEFFMNFEGAKDLLALVNGKVNQNLNKLVNEGFGKNDIKKLEEAQKYIAKIQSGSAELGVEMELTKRHGRSPIAEKLTAEEYAKALEEKIRSITLGLINEKIKTMPIANKGLNSLYESANAMLQRKDLSPKYREATKEFILSALRNQVLEVQDSASRKVDDLDKLIDNLNDPDWVEKMNKKAGKKRKKRSPADVKKEIEDSEKEKQKLEQDRRLKVMVLNFTMAKIAQE